MQSTTTPNDANVAKEWDRFFGRFSKNREYRQMLYRKSHGEDGLVQVARMCWDLCREDTTRLQKRLDEINLASLQQVTALKVKLSYATGSLMPQTWEPDEDAIQFYDPIRYLSETARELVKMIIGGKLHQISNKSEEVEFDDEIKEKLEQAEARAASAEFKLERVTKMFSSAKDQMDELRAQVDNLLERQRVFQEREKKLQARVGELEAELTDAKAQVAKLEIEKASLKEQISILAAQIVVLEEQRAKLQEENIRLEDENRRLEAENVALELELATVRDKIFELENALEQARNEVAELKEKLEKALQRIERLEKRLLEQQAKIEELKKKIQAKEAELKKAKIQIEELEARVFDLENELAMANARINEMEKEIEELNDRIWRMMNNKQDACNQTEMSGDIINQQVHENTQLKTLIDELQDKISLLMHGAHKEGIGEAVKKVSNAVGLHFVLKKTSIFYRLYDDARQRAARLERLREEHQKRRLQTERLISLQQNSSNPNDPMTLEEQILAQEMLAADERLTMNLQSEDAIDRHNELQGTLKPRTRREEWDPISIFHTVPAIPGEKSLQKSALQMLSGSLQSKGASLTLPHLSASRSSTANSIKETPWTTAESWTGAFSARTARDLGFRGSSPGQPNSARTSTMAQSTDSWFLPACAPHQALRCPDNVSWVLKPTTPGRRSSLFSDTGRLNGESWKPLDSQRSVGTEVR